MQNTLFVGKVRHKFAELHSTNEYAKELLSKSKPVEGTVIRADSQSAGRGQFGSRWESEAGKNILLSAILYPKFLEVGHQFLLSEAVALAVRDCVLHFLPENEVFVKWPNDVYILGRKAAGILIQNTLSSVGLSSSVLGIGLNVNQVVFSSDLPNATSLARAAQTTFDLEVVEDVLLRHIEVRYFQLKTASGRAEIQTEYHNALFLRDRPSAFVRTASSTEFVGTIRDVSSDGHLRIESGDGSIEHFEVKEIKFK